MSKTIINKANIDYNITGKGDPLLLIAGWGASQNSWLFQIGFFSKYFQVITFNNRGISNLDKPKEALSIKMMADDVIILMDYLKIGRANIWGVSMGGMIAQELAINYPKRVIKMILGSTHACQDEKYNGFFPHVYKALDMRIQGHYYPLVSLAFNKRLNRVIFYLLMKIEDMIIKSNKSGLSAQKAALLNHMTLDKLKLIESPTLIIVGNKDQVVRPTSSETIATLIPKAKILQIENGSHQIQIEMRNRVNHAVLEFLKTEK